MREEAIRIALEYSRKLTSKQHQELYQLIRYSNAYSEYKTGLKEMKLTNLIGTLVRSPRVASSDRRFWGMLKSALFHDNI